MMGVADWRLGSSRRVGSIWSPSHVCHKALDGGAQPIRAEGSGVEELGPWRGSRQ
jgi:hypothetical protein